MPNPESPHPDFSSDAGLRQVIEDMHIVSMAMSLVQLTGETDVLDLIRPHVHGPWDYSEVVPAELKAALRARFFTALRDHQHGKPLALIEPALMLSMLATAVGETVSPDYEPMIRAQMGLDQAIKAPDQIIARDRFHVAIIGAGVSGICAAIRLKEAGISFEIIEKNQDVGGTWLENQYPGCAVDTPNHFYQFSFEPNDDWPHYYSRQSANLDYLRHCADKYGIRPNIRFDCEADSAVFDEASGMWVVSYRNASGATTAVRANVLLSAVGQLNRPTIPDLPGLKDFAGTVVHTAQWPAELELKGKKVVLIGSGASAIQAGCAMAPQVEHLTVMQRSGPWVVRSPNMHRQVSEEMKWALRNVPFYAPWYRFQLFWGFADGLYPALRIDPDWDFSKGSINEKNDRIRQAMVRYATRELEDRPDLLAKVIPTYPPYGKRVLADPGWFRMLKRDNVELVTEGIAAIEKNGLHTNDGRLIEADILVMATGFHAGRMLWPMDIRGLGGQSIREVWGDNDPRAYLGVTAPQFPNMFVMYGPNTGLGHGGSFTFLAECQMRYVLGCIKAMVDGGLRSMQVRPEVFEQYNTTIDRELKNFVWSHPSVNSWYKNSQGRIIINSPWRLIDYWNLTLRPDLGEYITTS